MENSERSLLARFSTTFVKNYRITFLLFVAILILGYASYARFLTREGFPEVQFPLVLIQTPYFVNDVDLVDKDITSPIETAIAGIKEVKEIQSTTTENFSNIAVEFEQDFSTEEGAKILKEEVEKSANLPNGTEVEYRTINAGPLDGKHDLIFTISDDKSVEELQEKAGLVAEKMEKINVVAQANVIELITKETNPLTGKEFDYQSGFNRVGVKKDGNLEFSSAISIGIIKKGKTGILKLSDEVKKEVGELKDGGDLEGFEVSYGGDFADNLRKQINDLETNAVSALVAVVVLLFLLISWRASIVAAIFIPTVVAATFLGLFLIGYTLNVITLFSLILVLGLIVDDAVVVVEAIDYQKRQGLKGMKAIWSAIRDIGPADVAGTLTTVLVFLPMAFVSGPLGEFIKLIPITVILALILSIFIGLTITPFLSNIFIADLKEKIQRRGLVRISISVSDFILNSSSRMINKLGQWVSRFVYLYLKRWVLALLVVIATIVWLTVGASFATKLTFSVFPPPKDTDQIQITLNFPKNTDILQAEKIAIDAESVVMNSAQEHVTLINYFVANKDSAFINVELTPIESRTTTSREIVSSLKSGFADFGETRVLVEQAGVGPPTDEFQMNLQIFSDDHLLLEQSTKNVNSFLANKEIKGGGKVTEVLVDNLDNISKVDGRRFAVVKAKVSDPTNTGLILNLQEELKNEYGGDKLKSLGLEENALGFDLGQEGENIESFTSAAFALVIALILMYALLVFQFNSFSQPLLIFLAIPFTFPGLFPGLFFTENPLSFFVMLGIIALSGIVVNNTIFLVDFANQARREGKGIIDSITQAVQIRFRPILATSATTIAALLPLTLTNPFWESLGFTIIFGLISSSLLVILAFPVFYAIVEYLRTSRSRVWARLTRAGESSGAVN